MEDEAFQANSVSKGDNAPEAPGRPGSEGSAQHKQVFVSLKEMWEIYIKAVKSTDKSADNAKRQLMSLDIFLALCCEELDKSSTMPHFSDVKSVCNQLCKEFMSDILHVTSSANDDDISGLQKYLLEGRGWILLRFIHKSGAQNVSSGRDLAKLLVSLLPWCLRFPLSLQDNSNNIEENSLPLISSCFQDVVKALHGKLSQHKTSIPMSRQSNRGSHSNSRNGNRSHESVDKSKSSHKHKLSLNKEQSSGSDSDEEKRPTGRSRTKVKRKHRLIYLRNSTDLHSQKVESDSEDEDIDLLLGKLHKEHKKTTGYELCVLILDLLRDLTLSDIEQVSPVKYLSPTILPDLLETLGCKELNSGSEGDSVNEKACLSIKRHILQVVLTCCGIIASQQNGVNILIGHKLVEKLLSVAQGLCVTSIRKCNNILSNIGLLLKVNLLSDIILGLLLCISIVFDCLPFNPTFIKSAKHLMEDFDENQGFEHLQTVFNVFDWLKVSGIRFDWMEDDPVRIFGNFLNTIKVVRVNYIHSMKCVKRKHQKCSYSEYFDHHHDIMGVPANKTVLNEEDENLQLKGRSASQSSQRSQTPPSSQTVCMVAACTEVLLKGLQTAESKSMRLDILRVIYSSGVCCCMNLEEIVKTVVVSIENFSPAVRNYALETLNKVILEHFSGGIKYSLHIEGLLCIHCEAISNQVCDKNINTIYSYFHKPVLDELKGLDSGFSSDEIKKNFILSTFHKLSKFRAVHLLSPLLYSENESMAIAVAKHLLVLAIKGNPFLKAELFFSIYMKTLKLFKVNETQSSESSQCKDKKMESSQKCERSLSKTVQVHCLSALPYLLQANCVTKAFIAQQGILNMCSLLEDAIVRVPVLRVFEALIVLDEEKLDEHKASSHSDACPHPYKGGSVIGAFLEELSKRSFCSEQQFDSEIKGEESTASKVRRVRHNSVVCNRFSLPVLVDLWETCAKLSLHNKLFVAQFLLMDCLRQTEDLLLENLEGLVLSCIRLVKSQASTETEDSGLEVDSGSGRKTEENAFCMRVALMESLVVVIGACCCHLEKEGSVTPRTWQKVQDMFDVTCRYETSKLKMILDGLMNAGMPQYLSILGYSYSRNIALVHTRDDDIYDEDEVRHLLQAGSESEHDYLTTEMGYDADSEETNLDETERDKNLKWCLIRCNTPQKVYFPSVFKLLFNLMIMINQEESGKHVVTSVLHKLLQNVRADKQLVQAMCKEDILKLILEEDGFWSALIMKEEEGIAQDVLLGFVQQLGQDKMSPSELQKILQLFQHSDIPMENLLSVVLNIVENSHVAPHHYLEFPVRATGWSPAEWGDLMSEELETGGSTIGPVMRSMSNMLMLGTSVAENQQISQQEVWDTCAVKMSLKEFLTWPPFQKGFSLVMWVCLSEGQSNRFCPNMPLYNLETGSEQRVCPKSSVKSDYSTEKYIHLVSIGTREKMLEIWVDTGTYSLLFRLTSEVCSTGLVVQEAELKGIVSPVTWQHLVFSYVESLDGSTLTGTANLVIDGWQDHTFSLDHPFSAIKQRDKCSQLYPQLFLGHTVKDIATNQLGTWSFGSLMLLKGASIPKETCFHLYTLGPNIESILKCDCSDESVSYAPHLHKNTILHSKIPHDALVGQRKPDLTDIRSSILLTYTSKQEKTMCMFTPVVKGTSQSQGSFSSDSDTSLLAQQPRLVTPVVQGDLGSKVNSTLEKSVEESGGVAAILFLVAKIYENCDDKMNVERAEKLQARALQVLFAVVHHSSRLQQEYINIGGHALLAKVLTSCRSTVGYTILKVLLDAATTESLFKCPTGSDTVTVRHKSEAVVRDVTVIEHLIMNWNIWEGSHNDIMDLLFQAMSSLIREDHPYQAFNIKQFQVINLVNKIFRIYQERIQDSLPSLPVTVGQSAVAIIQNMIGSPPDYHMVMDLCDFLLNVHPAAKTFISHSKAGFYFNLSWGVPPSPLSKWRQDQKALMTSTPLKKRPSLPSDILPTAKRNLQQSMDGEDKLVKKAFPSLEVEDLTKPRSCSEPPTLVPRGDESAIQKADSIDKTAEEATEAGDSDQDHQNKNVEFMLESSLDKSSKSSKHSADEQENINTLRARGLTIDGLWTLNKNWDEMYKKDGEPIQEWRETESKTELVVSGNSDISEPVQTLGKNENSATQPLRPDAVKDQPDWLESFAENESEAEGDDLNSSSKDQRYPSKENLSINFDDGDADLAQAEEGLAALCVGLLKLLSTIIDMMPDSLSDKVFQKSIISPKTLIVLANSGSPEIRAYVIKVLSSYLKRCSVSQLDMFLKMDGFQLLASQLFQYPTYHQQMDEALSVVLQRNFRLDDGLQEGDCLDELSKIQQSSVCLFLALLGNSTGDLALCHNSLQLCCQLFENSNVLASVLVDAGLIEVLCGMILKLFNNDTSPRSLDIEGVDPNEILLSDIQNVLKVVAVREFRASGPQHYQHFEDILTLLKELETKEGEKHGVESKSVHTMRIFQHVILTEVFNLIEKASEEVSQQSFSIFPTRSLSHVPDGTARSQPSAHPTTNHTNKTANSLTHLQYALTGSFAKMTIQRKSSPGFLAHTDLPSADGFVNSGSGGDSDSSSQDSLITSVQTVNFPINKTGISRRKSMETSQDRLVRSKSLIQSVLSIGKRKKFTTIPISKSELIERLKKVLTLAIDLTVYTDRQPATLKKVVMLFDNTPYSVNADRKFQTRLFNFTYRAFEATLQQEKTIYKRNKNVIMWGAKDVLRVQLGRLLSFMLSSKQEVDQKIYALSFLMGESRGKEVLRLIISSAELGSDYAYLMYQLLTECQHLLSHQQYEDGSKFINILSGAGVCTLSPRKKQDIEYLEDKQRSMDIRHSTAKEMWLKRKEASLQRILHKFDSLSGKLTDSAMEVTQVVSQLQTQERKKFITHLKQNMTDKVAVKKRWQELVQNLTHERAVWFDKKSYPQSWELNPTEGPCRVRKRLQRGHLGIQAKFLKKEAQYKLEAEQVDPPLIYLFEEDHQKLSEAPALIYQLHINKKIRYTFQCTTVSPNNESDGELLIGEDSIFFVADEAVTDANYTQALLGNKDQLSMTWPFEDVVEIHRRWFELSDRGLEIFLTNGKTCLLAFDSSQDRDRLYQYLLMLELPNRRDTGNLFDGLDRWQNGQMTNFEYLTYLNKQAGRTFNDLMQYPVFPFILSDYTSEKIDLTDPRIYRDLVKPVSVQDPKNEQKFRDNYEILKSEYDRFGRAGMGSSVSGKPFHYGSHYSSSGTVLHFLVRLPPFTKMFINFQDQNFDIPDRTFHNLHTSWRLSSAESNTDVKELIPEFFFAHEFLLNSEGFDFGHRQNGSEVSDVVLPPWCKKNARLFMLIHRQALESDYVSDNITHWIDLVFGFKQQGEHAVKAINMFHPATYYGLDISSVKDPTERKAIQTMVRTYGQTPKQLFRVPHPPKKSSFQLRMTESKSNWGPQYQTVEGLKWGSYLGSPSQPDPEVVWEDSYSSQVASLIPLPMGVVFGISPNSCLLAQYSQDKQQKAILSDDPGPMTWAAILTWGMSDGLVRIINGTNKPAVNFIQHSPFEEITCCVSVPDCRHLFIGGTSGVITFYNTKYNPAKESQLQIFGYKKCLYGHTKTVTAMVVCRPYSVLVSASEDCTCIIWDLNRLSYVRSITSHKTEVKVIAISDTLGDIASVSRHGLGSNLHLHTINAELVATTTCKETINCLSYSNAPEGLSINIIAGGLSSGSIRMWSSWDLTEVRELNHNSLLATPIISLTFTHDSQRLFASSSDGRVLVWDNARQRVKSIRFRPFLYPADVR